MPFIAANFQWRRFWRDNGDFGFFLAILELVTLHESWEAKRRARVGGRATAGRALGNTNISIHKMRNTNVLQ